MVFPDHIYTHLLLAMYVCIHIHCCTSPCVLMQFFFVAVAGFVALRPKSTAMVIAGRSVHLTTLFPGQA